MNSEKYAAFYETYEKELADAAEDEIKQVIALVEAPKRIYYVNPHTRDRFIIREMSYDREGDIIQVVMRSTRDVVVESKSVILYKDWADLMKSIPLERNPFVVKSKVIYAQWQRENTRESRFK
jgi:hypothetical protein